MEIKMSMNIYTIAELKEDQKALAIKIKKLKSTRKEKPHGFVPGLWTASDDYRHNHIAYCLLRGTPYKMIEKTCIEEPRWERIKRLMKNIDLELCLAEAA